MSYKLKQSGAEVQKAIDLALEVPELSEAIADETTNRENAIADLRAEGVQQTPLFAESLEWLNENGDAEKLYVLPDGFIYSYMEKNITVYPTNQIKESINSDKTPFVGENGEDGYKRGYRLNSSGEEVALNSMGVTGFITGTVGDTIRFSNIAALGASSSARFCGYDASFNYVNQEYGDTIINAYSAGEYIIPSKLEGTVYFRISAKTLDEKSVVTVNESLEPTATTTKAWFNTGHAFIPADYEEEIIDLNRRVSILETSGTGERIDNYVIEEAERVAKNVYSRQNADTFTLIAISDAHYLATDKNIVVSNIHAGQGMDLVRENVNVDFAVCLGDNGWGSGVEGSETRATIEMGIGEIRSTNANIDRAFRGIPNFRSVGNHDSLIYNYTFNGNDYLDSTELFPLYGAYNRGLYFRVGRRNVDIAIVISKTGNCV